MSPRKLEENLGTRRPAESPLTELLLLISAQQAEALEKAAEELGLSAGQLIRRLLHQGLLLLQAPSQVG